MKINYFVFDTNCLISAALIGGSVNAQALDKVFTIGKLAMSTTTLEEFTEVLFRPKFDNYFTEERRLSFISKIERNAELFEVLEFITVCRDPKDNKFLELAIAADVSCIISGDKDLLILHPFRKIPILSPADFLKTFDINS